MWRDFVLKINNKYEEKKQMEDKMKILYEREKNEDKISISDHFKWVCNCLLWSTFKNSVWNVHKFEFKEYETSTKFFLNL